jgi:outer membrane protein TolC
VTSAVHRLQAARARQRVGEAAVAQARESERIVRDRFDAGLATPADLLRVSAASFDAEQRRVAAIADLLVRQAELDRTTGRSFEGAQP